MGLNGQMATRWFVARRFVGACLVGALVSIGCGGGGSPTVEDKPPDDKEDASDRPGKRGDAGGLPGPGIDPDDIIGAGDGPDGGGPTCTKITCDELDYTCGKTPDGCGGVLDCGTCAEGSECGIVTRHTCTELESLCMPIDKEEACEGKQCGSEGDGCGGLYDCGSCDEGEACGLDEAFQCGTLPASTVDDCVGKIDSCEAAGVTCGKIGNGCGGIIDCDAETGGCGEGEVCGLGGANECGVPPACEPIAADVACADKCGIVSNGCGEEVDGGLIDCSLLASSQCAEGTECGAGGVPNQCGTAETACVPVEQAVACATVECGVVSDGCAGSYACQGCAAGEQCQQGSCQPLCVPVDQATACAGKACGSVSDQCGGSYQCGTCPAGRQCGGSAPFQCSLIPTGPGSEDCVPVDPTLACDGRDCGTVFDGCGSDPENEIDCSVEGNGGCAEGELCGIVAPFQCDEPPGADCESDTTCAELNWACGMAIDECGDVIDCSGEGLACGEFEACVGGIDGPTECIAGGGSGSHANCDVCHAIPDCSGQPLTQLTGRVITPGKNDGDTANQVGVPNAFVYILRNNDVSELPAIPEGIPSGGTSCDRCEDQDLGPVLASATTNARGEYTLEGNIPVDEEFVLVVKIGKWRRAVQLELDSNDACTATALAPLVTRLPRTRTDGLGVNIPRIAVSTGGIDAMECVFYKMGVNSSEFVEPGTNATAAGRVHMYRANGGRPASGSTADSNLYGSKARMFMYDMVVFDCEGGGYGDHNSSDPNVREYVNSGGRMFASHLSHTWIDDNTGSGAYAEATAINTGLSASATFGDDDYFQTSGVGYVSTDRPNANQTKIHKFAEWLEHEGAASESDGTYSFSILEPRPPARSVGAHSEEYVFKNESFGTSVQQYAFNTPYGAPEDAICGRVAYSAFHVSAGGGTPGSNPFDNAIFPGYCDTYTGATLTAEEKTLLFMLFDLGACVSTDEPVVPTCNPETCGTRCGIVPDGCGGTLSCGACPPPSCIPTTCSAEGATCGTIADGCGGTVTCGPCEAGQICGLVAPNQCAPVCTPMDEATACADSCGFVSDGCGGVYECSGCDGSLSCIDEACVPGQCMPLTECPAGIECGQISDGCDGMLNCGSCVAPETCGGGGVANECGAPQCDPLTCESTQAECGWIGDGCGLAVNCGGCPMGQVCGAGGPNQCDGCQPRTCESAGAECGAIGDGCGGVVQCGSCESGKTCGAQAANQCGTGPSCTPRTCASINAECGTIGDGCGGTVNCGICDPGFVCGIEEAFQCDPAPDCEPFSCEDQDAECGAVGDGCGGLLDCGGCPAGYQCGLLAANQCDAPRITK